MGTFTLFTGNEPTVAKGYDVIDGKLKKIDADNFYRGAFETLTTKPDGLGDIIRSLKQGQFLTAGVHPTLTSGRCPNDASRSVEEFPLPDGEGLLIFDGDSLPEFGVTSAEDYLSKLASLSQPILLASKVCTPSASSGIVFNGDGTGLRGLHCFMIVDNAKTIPFIIETLHKRSVIAGWARPQVTANGVILIKSLVDTAMKTSNQPCFEGGARLLNKAITQHREIEVWDGGVLRAAEITPLTLDEKAAYDNACVKLKSSVQVQANAVHTAWRAQREAEAVENGATPEQAKQILDKAIDGGDLYGEYIIRTDKFGAVTVAEIITNAAKYHEATCADPIDPDYGQNKAKIYSQQDKPCINSMAHGIGSRFFLHGSIADEPHYTRSDLAEMIAVTDDFDELTGRIAKLVATSQLREAERDALHKAISKKSGATLASLKQDAKTFQRVTATHESDHLTAARGVISALGEGNLLHANGFLWGWRGDGVWRRTDDREVKQTIHGVAASKELTAAVVSSVLDLVKTEAHLPGHRFDGNTTTINCANGELVIESGNWQLTPHVREHYRTAMVPVTYDPAADAPRFRQFLAEVFDDDADAGDKISIVLEALGYTLIPSCHLEKFFMLIGAGANGKSVLLAVLAELVGRAYTCAVQPSQFENRFQRGHLQGKLANIITEIAEGAEIADAQLKSLVSGEMTTAEHKHKDPFDFTPYAKHWFGTNHLPHTRDFSDALFRRAIILSFNNKFEGANRDVHLIDKLRAELPGILSMALDGLKRLIENKAFTECASSADIARKWRIEADQVAQFVGDACNIEKGCRASSADLYNAYKHWADGAGVRRTVNRNTFTSRLERLGYAKGRGAAGTRMIEGLKPKWPNGQPGAR